VKALYIFVMIIGVALIGVGIFLYMEAGRAIAAGQSFWGLGWGFLDISPREANAYQAGGIAAAVLGAGMFIFGLVATLRK